MWLLGWAPPVAAHFGECTMIAWPSSSFLLCTRTSNSGCIDDNFECQSIRYRNVFSRCTGRRSYFNTRFVNIHNFMFSSSYGLWSVTSCVPVLGARYQFCMQHCPSVVQSVERKCSHRVCGTNQWPQSTNCM